MIFYIVEERYVANPVKYICFGLKALKEINSIGLGVKLLEKITEKDLIKNNYSEKEYTFFFHDTNNHSYLNDVNKILSKILLTN